MKKLTATNGKTGMKIRYMNTIYTILEIEFDRYNVVMHYNDNHKRSVYFLFHNLLYTDVEILNVPKRNRPGDIK